MLGVGVSNRGWGQELVLGLDLGSGSMLKLETWDLG